MEQMVRASNYQLPTFTELLLLNFLFRFFLCMNIKQPFLPIVVKLRSNLQNKTEAKLVFIQLLLSV